MQRLQYEYKVFKDGEIKYIGTKEQITYLLKVSGYELVKCCKENKKIKGNYDVERKLLHYKEIKEFNVDNVNIDEELKTGNLKQIDYLKRHLLTFGNTILGSMPRRKVEKILNILEKKEGIKTIYRSVRYEGERRNWYVIEVDNGRNRNH